MEIVVDCLARADQGYGYPASGGCKSWMNWSIAEVVIKLKRCTRPGARHDFMFRLAWNRDGRGFGISLLIFTEKEANKVQRYNRLQNDIFFNFGLL